MYIELEEKVARLAVGAAERFAPTAMKAAEKLGAEAMEKVLGKTNATSLKKAFSQLRWSSDVNSTSELPEFAWTDSHNTDLVPRGSKFILPDGALHVHEDGTVATTFRSIDRRGEVFAQGHAVFSPDGSEFAKFFTKGSYTSARRDGGDFVSIKGDGRTLTMDKMFDGTRFGIENPRQLATSMEMNSPNTYGPLFTVRTMLDPTSDFYFKPKWLQALSSQHIPLESKGSLVPVTLDARLPEQFFAESANDLLKTRDRLYPYADALRAVYP